MAEKASHDEADYRTGTAERRCAICTMFERARNDGWPHCTAVVDPIRAGGLCDYYKHKRPAPATTRYFR